MTDDIQQVIKTHELRLVDKNGSERAALMVEDNGDVVLKFEDGSAVPRARFGVTSNGAALIELGRGTGHSNFSIGVEKDGRIIVQGYDNEGVERFKLEIKGNGSHTELSFHEKNKKPRMVLMAEDKGPAGLFILDQYGKALFSTTP
jgi:hypothetical protein